MKKLIRRIVRRTGGRDTGTGNIGVGNALDNVINGTANADVLMGADGNDTLNGRDGGDRMRWRKAANDGEYQTQFTRSAA